MRPLSVVMVSLAGSLVTLHGHVGEAPVRRGADRYDVRHGVGEVCPTHRRRSSCAGREYISTVVHRRVSSKRGAT